ncbi:MAG: hypothetical protein INH41_26125 [Myxococcaceae bacterium]|nr:hypothetical protein [Myxococcaceae bacterium]MCA3015880.1 hypothetical protein [Myxococcaceae bacterium]
MRLLLTYTLLSAGLAGAWPVDWVHDVEAGRERFVRLPRLDWFEVEAPGVVQVEWLAEAGELLLTGLKPGRTTVLLGAEGRVAAWRVRVASRPLVDEGAWKAAKAACPDLRSTPLDEVKLAVTVHDDACRLALLALFQTDAVEARGLELTFSQQALQTQLKDLQRAYDAVAKGKVRARYVGAGLVLAGQVTPAEHRRVLWETLRRGLGRFALDDQLELVEAPPPDTAPDAGARRPTPASR